MTATHKYHELLFRLGPERIIKRSRDLKPFLEKVKNLRLHRRRMVVLMCYASLQIFLLSIIIRGMHQDYTLAYFLPTPISVKIGYAWDAINAALRF